MINLPFPSIHGKDKPSVLEVLHCGRFFILFFSVRFVWCVGVCVGCLSKMFVAHVHILCTHTHMHTLSLLLSIALSSRGDTVTAIRPSQASAHACDVTWSFTFYMTVGHLAVNLCRLCPLSMLSEEARQIEGVTQCPSFDLCYCFYSTRRCSDTWGLWRAVMGPVITQMLCICAPGEIGMLYDWIIPQDFENLTQLEWCGQMIANQSFFSK